MIKKFFILPILWVIGLGITSANCIVDITSVDDTYSPYYLTLSEDYTFTSSDYSNYSTSESSTRYFWIVSLSSSSDYDIMNFSNCYIKVNGYGVASYWSNACSFNAWDTIYFVKGDKQTFNTISLNWPFTSCSSSDNWDNSSTAFPIIPSSFTNWLTWLLSKFGATIVWRLPTIILVSLWIFAIFTLFRVVRNYARSSFNW